MSHARKARPISPAAERKSCSPPFKQAVIPGRDPGIQAFFFYPLPAVILGLDPRIQVKRKAVNTKVTKGTKDTKGFIGFVVIPGRDPGIQVKRKAFNTKVTKGTKDTKGFIVFVVIPGRDPRIQVRKAVTMKGMKTMKGPNDRKPQTGAGRWLHASQCGR